MSDKWQIGDGSIVVDLFPGRGVLENKAMTGARARSINGISGHTKWGEFERFDLPMKYVPSSDGLQLNEWWENQTTLTFSMDLRNFQVKFINATQPLPRTSKPYTTEYQGNLKIEQI